VDATVTYQDRATWPMASDTQSPRQCWAAIPAWPSRMPGADLCCGAPAFNVVQNEMSDADSGHKDGGGEFHRGEIIATANPGCCCSSAGVRL